MSLWHRWCSRELSATWETTSPRSVPSGAPWAAELQAQPGGEVAQLALHARRDGLAEPDVLVDRVDHEPAGLAIRLGVQLPDEPVVVEDRQREVAPAALVLGLVHLEDVLETPQLLGADAVVDEPVERRE